MHFLLKFPKLITCITLSLLLTQCAKLKPSAYNNLGPSAPSVRSADFKQKLATAAKAKWHDGSHVTTLPNGDAFFPQMRDAVNSAKKSITFETFAMVSGTETYYFCHALAAKAQQGVKVHVILDGIGSRKLGKVCTDILVNSGCQLQWYRKFNPLRLYHINNRDHRKFLIVDGKVGFTGGAGYANAWMGNASNPSEWRDTMYKVTGTAVADMQTIFSDNWQELTGKQISGPDYFPPLTNTGNMSVQTTMGAPRERIDTLGASYLLAIDAAKKSILIEHAYFAPNNRLLTAIKRALARGVEVKIIVPGASIDSKILREASKIYWPRLMKAGAEIYEYQTTMLHGKLIVIDDHLTICGSGNFDDRTYFINDEANLHVLSSPLAAQQKAMFYNDLKNCKRMTLKDAKMKFTPKDIYNRIGARLIMPQL
ncbi:MAG: phospholipase D-like domain-containing protein [Akkermansiaceae bacterium]